MTYKETQELFGWNNHDVTVIYVYCKDHVIEMATNPITNNEFFLKDDADKYMQDNPLDDSDKSYNPWYEACDYLEDCVRDERQGLIN